ncbi:MAG: hypothetical protein WDM76_15565 [Limisphaerales bacterium]
MGKTLLAKTLAEQMFGDAKSLIHLDMSEYMEKIQRVAPHRFAARLYRLRRGADNSRKKSGAIHIPSYYSTKSKRRIPTCGICCCRFWKTES